MVFSHQVIYSRGIFDTNLHLNIVSYKPERRGLGRLYHSRPEHHEYLFEQSSEALFLVIGTARLPPIRELNRSNPVFLIPFPKLSLTAISTRY